MGYDECRFLDPFDDIGHGKGFAGAGNAEEGRVFFASIYPVDEFLDGLQLVAARHKR